MRNNIYTFIMLCLCLCSLNEGTAQQQLTIDLKERATASNAAFTEVDVHITHFDNFLSMQFAMLWDPEVLELESIDNLTDDLPDFSASSMSTPSQTNDAGVLRLSWLSGAVNPVSLSADHRLFSVKFKYVGEACEESEVKIGDAQPIVVEFIDEDFNDIPLHTNNIVVAIPGVGCSGPITCKDVLEVNVTPWVCEGTIEVEDIIGNHAYDTAEVTPSVLTMDQLNTAVDVTTVVSYNGETTTCLTSATLVDRVAPVAVVKTNIVVALTESGTSGPSAKLYALSVDNGSFDACGEVTFVPEFYEFDCSDIGEQTITLVVYDEAGNSNSTFATVTIEYNLTGMPSLICPADISVECSVDIFDETVISNVLGNGTVDFGCAPLHSTLYDYDENGDGDIHDVFMFQGLEVKEKFEKTCNYGPVVRTWKIPGTSISCKQIIVIAEADSFDGSTQIDWPYSKDAFVAVTSNDGSQACNNTSTHPGNVYNPDNIVLTPNTGIPTQAEVTILCKEDLCELPSWDENTCALIGFSIESDSFFFEDGACLKIINTYTVIDWCTYDPFISPNEGIWTWTVIGKLDDDVAPVIDAEDSINTECTDVIHVSATATDYNTDDNGTSVAFSCPSGQIRWNVFVDIGDDGTYDLEWSSFVPEDANTSNDPLWSDDNEAENIAQFGYGIPDVRVGNKGDVDNASGPTTRSGHEYIINLREGINSAPGVAHRVYWTVQDGCGNVSETTSYFSVDGSVDEIKPTPYCVNLSTAILLQSGSSTTPSVELYAIDFNDGSFDNCTAKENLRYTFTDTPPSQDPAYQDNLRSSSRVFTEADLNSTPSGFINLQMYVWDQSGNYDFCNIKLKLKSPDDPCNLTNVKCDHIIASLDDNAQVKLWIEDFNVTYDNPCGIADIDLSFSNFHTDVNNIILTCNDLGQYTYEIFVYQNNHQTTSCKNTVTLIDPLNKCTNSGKDVVLNFGIHYGAKGSNVCIPFTTDYFHNVESFQGSAAWDENVLSYTGTTNYNLPGLSNSSFATQNTAEGHLGFLWFDATGTTPITLSNGSTLFEICFDVIGEEGDFSVITVSDSPVPTQVANTSGEINHIIDLGEFIVGEDPCASGHDTEKPTPHCHASLTAYLQHTTGSGNGDAEVKVWAIDFNAGSFDNCTPNSELRFSFSSTNPDNDPEFVQGERSSSRIYTEADVTNSNATIDLKVYVWDNADNYDFCAVSITIKDVNADPCLNNTEANIHWPLEVIEMSETNVNLNAISNQFSVHNLANVYTYSLTDVEPTFINTICTDGLVYSYEDIVILTGGYTFKIVRTFTVLDWYTGNVYTYVQLIKNVDPSNHICDFLPNTAPVGDCDSGHSLDDDVEWPADISFADHRILPTELRIFSNIPAKDVQPVFYNADAALYHATYVDLLNSLSTVELVIGRQWTVTRSDNPNVSWKYEQLLTVDITIFGNLVTVNTINNRPIPNVQITNSVATDLNGAAIVVSNEDLEPKLLDEETNGLDLRDLVLIRSHIIGQNFLNDLQLIAGDMNNDQSVTSLDLALVMGTMIGQSSGYSEEWRFLDYTNNTTLGATPKGHYIGVKPGDVDDSAEFAPANPQMENENLFITDQLLNNGETYIVPMTLENAIDAWGVHLNIDYNTDVMEIINVYSDHFDSSMLWNETTPGQISVISVSQSGSVHSIDDSVTNENILVYVEFRALRNDVIGENLRLSEDKLSYVLMEDFSSRRFAGNLDGEITVNTIDIDGKVNVTVYPNPTSEYLNLRLSGPLTGENFELEILNVQGQKLMNYSDVNMIDVSSLSPGMYIYKIYVNDKIIADRFMVTR